jgi:hypothetical protein
VPEYTNIFHTLHSRLGINDSERHLVLKYCSDMPMYIQTKMDFLGISSLVATYQYAVKIEQKFKKWSKWEFGFENVPQQKHGKGNPNSQNEGQVRKEGQTQEIQSKIHGKKGNEKFKKDIRKWCEFHKIPWHNTDECRSKQSLVSDLKEKELEPNLDFDSEHHKGK